MISQKSRDQVLEKLKINNKKKNKRKLWDIGSMCKGMNKNQRETMVLQF